MTTALNQLIDASSLDLDEVTHQYSLGGKRVAGTTEVLQAVGISDFSMVEPHVLDAAQRRGTAVHKATWYDDQGDLQESTVDPAIMPYLFAWRKFRAEANFYPEMIEGKVYCPRYRYAGTFDRIGVVGKWGHALVDIKTGSRSPSWQIQLAAYLRAYSGHRSTTLKRLVVQLLPNGNYKLHWFEAETLIADWNVFAGALSVFYYRLENGIL